MNNWLIFEPTDDTLRLFEHVGTVPASGREQARNRFYRGRTEPIACVAVPETQWTPTLWEPPVRLSARVKPLTMPTAPGASAPVVAEGENVTALHPPDPDDETTSLPLGVHPA